MWNGKIWTSGIGQAAQFALGDNRGAFARYRVPDNVNEVVAGSRTSCLSKLAGKRSASPGKPANSIAEHVTESSRGCGIDNRVEPWHFVAPYSRFFSTSNHPMHDFHPLNENLIHPRNRCKSRYSSAEWRSAVLSSVNLKLRLLMIF